MNMVDWFKGMVASRRGEELVDPLIEVQPSPRALKRALLVCLRCIDMDAHKRPKMGQIVHMLEADDFPFRSVSHAITHSYASVLITLIEKSVSTEMTSPASCHSLLVLFQLVYCYYLFPLSG